MLVRFQTRQSGFTLVELMVGLVILAILASVALPSFQSWTQNTKIRNAAESIASGIQRARAEAVARNLRVEFVLSNTLDSSWAINSLDAVSAVIESRSSSEGSREVSLTALAADLSTAATTITYNNFGGVAPNADGSESLAQIDLGITGGNRNLRVVISTGGIVRMCDPNVASGSLSAC